MKKNINKFLSVSIALTVIVLLVLAGPAQAFILGLSVLDDTVFFSESVNFQLSAEIESGERKNITHFTLKLTGPENISCMFYPNGTIISGCPGITIVQVEDTSFGYGYGYGYGFEPGFFKYNVTVSPGTLEVGNYNARLIAAVDDNDILSSITSFTVFEDETLINGCSIRARDGQVTLDSQIFSGNSKLSLNSPLKNLKNAGQGGFESQGNKRISYKFKINKATAVNQIITFNVTGTFMDVNKNKSSKDSIIIFNKATNKVDIISSGFNVQGMSVNFVRRC